MTSTGTEFGSDKHGLVWGYLFQNGEPARPILGDEALDSLRGGTDRPDSFLWLHFSLTNAATERWLQGNLVLPEAFYESLREGVVSTRVEQSGDSLLAILHDVLFDFAFSASDVSTVYLCVQPRLLVSARPKPLRSIDRLRAAAKAGEAFRSAAELLAHLLRDQASVLVEIVRQATARVDGIEDKLLSSRISASRAELGALRRLLVRLQRVLAPEPAALFSLLGRPPVWIGEIDIQDLRHSAEEFSTAVADSAALVERIKLLQEELAALINEQTNRILLLLTVVTVVALPFNVIAGLFGMNVGGIPLAQAHHGFATIIVIVAVFTLAAAWLAVRRREW